MPLWSAPLRRWTAAPERRHQVIVVRNCDLLPQRPPQQGGPRWTRIGTARGIKGRTLAQAGGPVCRRVATRPVRALAGARWSARRRPRLHQRSACLSVTAHPPDNVDVSAHGGGRDVPAFRCDAPPLKEHAGDGKREASGKGRLRSAVIVGGGHVQWRRIGQGRRCDGACRHILWMVQQVDNVAQDLGWQIQEAQGVGHGAFFACSWVVRYRRAVGTMHRQKAHHSFSLALSALLVPRHCVLHTMHVQSTRRRKSYSGERSAGVLVDVIASGGQTQEKKETRQRSSRAAKDEPSTKRKNRTFCLLRFYILYFIFFFACPGIQKIFCAASESRMPPVVLVLCFLSRSKGRMGAE